MTLATVCVLETFNRIIGVYFQLTWILCSQARVTSDYWHWGHLTRPDMSHTVHLSFTLPCHMLVVTLLPPHTGQGWWPQPPQPRHTASTPALSRSGDSSRLSSPVSLSLTRPASSWSKNRLLWVLSYIKMANFILPQEENHGGRPGAGGGGTAHSPGVAPAQSCILCSDRDPSQQLCKNPMHIRWEQTIRSGIY